MEKSITCIGIDGCQAGWICSYKEDQKEWKFEIFPKIENFWKEFSYAILVLIDIPIGLKDNGSQPRLCDKAARKYLTRTRSSSIFPTPCRGSLYANSYIDANQINRKMTGKGLSKQTWNITSKIRNVDILLRNDPKASKVFIESHPEICFAALSNGTPMQHYKKTNEGIKERLSIIESFCENPNKILNKLSLQFSKEKAALDDILDAWILAISGSKGLSNLRFLPDKYEYDSEGLPMRMGIPNFR
jgi:predicted RNase H-like nuclease